MKSAGRTRRRALTVETLEDRCVPTYAVVDLGFLPDGWANTTNDINDIGQVVGLSSGQGINRAYVFTPDSPNSAAGKMTNLGALPEHRASEALAISGNGWVAGYSRLTAHHIDPNPVAWIPDANNGTTLLQIKDNNSDTNDLGQALGVNSTGKVVGFINGGAYAGRAFVWERTPSGDVLTDLHDLLPSDAVLQSMALAGVFVYEAAAINDNNQIVANGTVSGSHVSMLLTDDDGWFHNGGMTVTNLGNLGGWITSRDINNQGQIVGEAWLSAERQVTDQRGFLWDNGSLTALPPLRRQNVSTARGINDHGDIVGESGVGFPLSHPVMWQDGWVSDLIRQIPSDSGWDLDQAFAINNSGQIVGYGDPPHTTFSGVFDPAERGYLLTTTALPQVSIADISITEGNSGEKAATLTVKLSAPSSAAVSVDFFTHFYGSCKADVDFVNIPYSSRGTITFAPSQMSQTLSVTIKGDTVFGDGTDDSGDEFFYVNLIHAAGAVFLDAQAKVVILDDDGSGSGGGGGGKGGGPKKLLADSMSRNADTQTVSLNEVRPLLTEAIQRFAVMGFNVSTLNNVDVRVQDLPGPTLGLASGNTIWLDDNAAGWGWFVDPMPWDDSEFTMPGDQGEQNRMDLLTVLAHEIGHLLGYEHELHGVMREILAAGERLTLHGIDVDDWWQAGLLDLTQKRDWFGRRP